MRYSGANYQTMEDAPFSEECGRNARLNGLLSNMNTSTNSFVEVSYLLVVYFVVFY